MRGGSQWIERRRRVDEIGGFVQSVQREVNDAGCHENPRIARRQSQRACYLANCGRPVPIVDRVYESQMSVGDGGIRIEPKYAFGRTARALEAHRGRRKSPFGDVQVQEGKRFGNAYRCRIELKRLLKVASRPLKPRPVKTFKLMATTQVEVVRDATLQAG